MAVAIEVPACPTVNWSYSLSAGFGKAADAAGVAQRLETRLAAGDDLVRVALVAHVPQQLVPLEIEDVVQRQRQLDRPQIAGQMAAALTDGTQYELADLLRQSVQLGHRKLLQVRRTANVIQVLTHI